MKADMIVDLQFGSTGKGLIAGFMAESRHYDAAVTANGPNAGHTSYVGPHKVVRCALPNSPCHSRSIKDVFVAPGAVFDVEVLLAEWADTLTHNPGCRLHIHPHAAVVTDEHAKRERRDLLRIGSTQKGTGAAMVEKAMRLPSASLAKDYDELVPFTPRTGEEWEDRLHSSGAVLVEGSQGFSLGLNSGFWPYCTSRECTAHQLASDCLIPRKAIRAVAGVCRTFPIRVANRYNEEGVMVGYSGGHYPDQRETSFLEVGAPVELTTVTKLPRRIFTFSLEQVKRAVRRNGCDAVALTFADYLGEERAAELAVSIEEATGVRVELLSFGPRSSDIRTFDSGVRHERFV